MNKNVDVSKIKVGDVFRNYKELCNVLGEKVKNGRSKIYQIQNWERYFSYLKEGISFKILDIFDEPLPLVDGRSKGNNQIMTPLTESHPSMCKEWLTAKNGNLTNDITRRTHTKYWWLCSVCDTEIYTSPSKRVVHPYGENDYKCYNCKMSSYAKKVHLLLNKLDLTIVTEKTFEGLLGVNGGNLRFDFAVVKENEELLLIEYDGEYHFKEYHNDTKMFEYVKYHDDLKDEFCKENNIPLLRISAKEKHNIPQILFAFLLEHKAISKDNKVVMKEIEKLNNKINKNNRQIENLKETITKLEKENELINKLKGETNE